MWWRVLCVLLCCVGWLLGVGDAIHGKPNLQEEEGANNNWTRSGRPCHCLEICSTTRAVVSRPSPGWVRPLKKSGSSSNLQSNSIYLLFLEKTFGWPNEKQT